MFRIVSFVIALSLVSVPAMPKEIEKIIMECTQKLKNGKTKVSKFRYLNRTEFEKPRFQMYGKRGWVPFCDTSTIKVNVRVNDNHYMVLNFRESTGVFEYSKRKVCQTGHFRGPPKVIKSNPPLYPNLMATTDVVLDFEKLEWRRRDSILGKCELVR